MYGEYLGVIEFINWIEKSYKYLKENHKIK